MDARGHEIPEDLKDHSLTSNAALAPKAFGGDRHVEMALPTFAVSSMAPMLFGNIEHFEGSRGQCLAQSSANNVCDFLAEDRRGIIIS